MTAPAACDVDPVAVGPLLEVDPGAVAANTRLFARRTNAHLMAVVKADGFGHGAADLARTALAHGATWLGVTSLDEAAVLRRAGIVAPLLSWLNPVHADFEVAPRQRVDVAVPSVEHLMAVRAAAAAAGRRARVHLHLDTGMARDGAPPQQWRSLMVLARAAEQHGLVDVVGVMGHLACADVPGHPANTAGRHAFLRGVDLALRAGLRPQVRHLAATAATLTDRRSHFDLVRVGAGLVGIDPSGTTVLRPALSLTAPVVNIRRVPAGTGVGYGHTRHTDRPTHLGLLPLGYADGLPRAASGRAEVAVAGRHCPVIGTISMDQTVIDLGDRPVPPGTTATVFGTGADGPSVAEWARWSGTIAHEIVTGIGARVHRTPGGHHEPGLR